MSRVIDNNKIESFSNPIFDSKYRLQQQQQQQQQQPQQQPIRSNRSHYQLSQQQQHFKKFYQQNSSRSNSTNRKSVLFSPPSGNYCRSTTAVSGFSSPFHYQKNFLKYKMCKKTPSASASPFTNGSDDNDDNGTTIVRRTLSLDTICDDDRKRRRPLISSNDCDPANDADGAAGLMLLAQRKYQMVDKETQTDDFPVQSLAVSVSPPALADNKFTAVDDHSQFVQNSCRIGSMEALDEEIEKLVSSKHNSDGEVAKLTRTVKTQTPSTLFATSSDDRNGLSSGGVGSDFAKQNGFSPQINHFAARGPPAGCEKVVHLKVVADETTRRSLFQTSSSDPRHSEQLRPNAVFDLKPSSCSAFCSLQQNRY